MLGSYQLSALSHQLSAVSFQLSEQIVRFGGDF